ncbi:sigma factor G inhibitor Gin [Hazenella sp. IB182353]|uniref:sigma factor G inhibitor Gin n=1 Tax=Polycladospora coralii TaxID=2771432 RepID=UPI001746BD0B|nr:sigma factor G inhibitor Gin [Polycladospora coralii]MBS7531811.1 sigma factor G inhibitor Gin [Polycladospora coralii]
MQTETVLNRCVICEKLNADGLEIMGKWICVSCETDMVKRNVDDVQYWYYVMKLRQLFNQS